MSRYNEIKNELSQKLGYESLSDLRLDYATYGRMELFMDKVSELYANF